MDRTIDEKMKDLFWDIENGKVPDDMDKGQAATDKAKEKEKLPPPEIKIEITRDKMTAFLNAKVSSPEQQIFPDDIIKKLNEKGVIYGINNELIREFCSKRQFFKSIRAAIGLQPTKGDDGKLTFYFLRELSSAPVELEDGTLDFKNLNNIENVAKDDLLCTMVPPGAGADGIDLFNNVVPAQFGRAAQMPTGKNVLMSEDGLSLYATVDGSITYKGGVITIDDCRIIKTDVGPETGNVEYNGSLVINGSIMEGFSVKAAKDITVRGNVEGAKVTAGGNIVLVGGINGMNKGLVKSGGDITSKYTENVTIDCGGNFRTDVSINCTVWAKGAIIVKGKNGAILSGNYVANDFIYVKTVGSENRNNTNLVVQNMWYLKSKEFGDSTKFDPRLNARDIAETQKQLDNTNRVVEMIKSPSGPFTTPAERAAALKKVILMKSQLNHTMAELQKQLEGFNRGKDKTRLRVICPGVIYPGGKITLDRSCIRVEHAIRNQKIYPEDGEIVYGTITSVEKEIG